MHRSARRSKEDRRHDRKIQVNGAWPFGRAKICAELGLTDSQFGVARTLGFPEARESTTTGWWPKRIVAWKAEEVLDWAERVRSLGLLKK
jgi:hypothetical protein